MRKKIKHDARLIILVLLILLVISSNFLLYWYFQNNRHEIENNYINKLNNEYIITMSVYSDMADLIFRLAIDRPRIKNIFARGTEARDEVTKNRYRKLLYGELSGLYENLLKYNFRQLHFHEKNNRSFLRFHRPKKFGDDLTGIRFSVEYTNREKKHISGFEEGRIFNGYRFLYPLASNNKHVGSVEVSVSMKTVIRQLSEKFNKEAQFIILKEQVRQKVFESELSNYIPWFIDDTYVLDKAISEKCILENRISASDAARLRTSLDLYRKTGRPFCHEVDIDKQPGLITFLPIQNLAGRNVASIFVIADSKKLRDHTKSFYLVLGALILLLIVLLAFTFYYRVSQKKIERMATFDSLTGLYARGVLFEKLDHEFARYMRYRKPFSILMFDVDHFKNINDTHGHTTGDIILSGIAEIMKRNIRKTDSIGRYGGEEFLVLLPETPEDEAYLVAENLRQKISAHYFHSPGTVTVSCGVAVITEKTETIEKLIDKADGKLYQAKNEGRNRVIA